MLRAPMPRDRLVDARGRPYFLWDVDMTLDDVLEFVDWDRIQRDWPRMARYLGRRREFWAWWLARVGRAVDAQ